jgi:hypothetical protein
MNSDAGRKPASGTLPVGHSGPASTIASHPMQSPIHQGQPPVYFPVGTADASTTYGIGNQFNLEAWKQHGENCSEHGDVLQLLNPSASGSSAAGKPPMQRWLAEEAKERSAIWSNEDGVLSPARECDCGEPITTRRLSGSAHAASSAAGRTSHARTEPAAVARDN